jgi:hypothetical protein
MPRAQPRSAGVDELPRPGFALVCPLDAHDRDGAHLKLGKRLVGKPPNRG